MPKVFIDTESILAVSIRQELVSEVNKGISNAGPGFRSRQVYV